MASYAFLYAFALTLLLASGSTIMSSPEPEFDPMGGPALAIVSTGTAMRPMKFLNKVNKICPKDYPTGFSILCHPGGPSRKARFFVNNKLVKTERKEPYYIAGDFKGRVRPWKAYPRRARIRCKVSKRSKVRAKIIFAC